VITVGATKSTDGIRSHDEIASYSSRGPTRLDYVMKPDLVAPGNRVISLYTLGTGLFQYGTLNQYGVPMNTYTTDTSGKLSKDYLRLSGTSMAAPVVAGAAALLLEKNPGLSPDSVKARLMISADNRVLASGKTDPFTYGAGFLNIPAALASTAIATHTAVSPSVKLHSDGSLWLNGSEIMLSANEGAWGTNVVNPTQVIWGGGGDVSAISDVLDTTQTLLDPTPAPLVGGLWGNTSVWSESFGAVDLSYTVLFGEN
jgi:serine protease AprX